MISRLSKLFRRAIETSFKWVIPTSDSLSPQGWNSTVITGGCIQNEIKHSILNLLSDLDYGLCTQIQAVIGNWFCTSVHTTWCCKMSEILTVVSFRTQFSRSQQQDKAEHVKVGAFEDKGPGTGREDMQDAQPHDKVANGFRVRAFSWKSTSASPSHIFQVSRCQCKCVPSLF